MEEIKNEQAKQWNEKQVFQKITKENVFFKGKGKGEG